MEVPLEICRARVSASWKRNAKMCVPLFVPLFALVGWLLICLLFLFPAQDTNRAGMGILLLSLLLLGAAYTAVVLSVHTRVTRLSASLVSPADYPKRPHAPRRYSPVPTMDQLSTGRMSTDGRFALPVVLVVLIAFLACLWMLLGGY